MKNKEYCMSSYMAFRYIYEDEMDFEEGMHHQNIIPLTDDKKIPCKTSDDIGKNIEKQINALKLKYKKLGILLSGGMDSAIVASYMSGCDAYTFRFMNGEFQKEELKRAEYYANYYNLKLHYVDITWETVVSYLKPVMKSKNAPVHSIEPQILQAALQAKNDGCDIILIGESSDLVFGGMDGLLAKDWTLNEFVDRYTFTDPKKVLKNPVSMLYVYEKYKLENGKIDFMKFMDDVFSIESSSSYLNAFKVANVEYYDPYAYLKMADSLDLNRVRNGESKYLVRELMAKRYPELPVPNKTPMPRPVDAYFKNWEGPKREEFISNLDMNEFTGNQKWQLFCLEQFLNMLENDNR